MAAIPFVFVVRNSASSPPGARMTGLTPTWVFLKKVPSLVAVGSPPSFTEIGYGKYMTLYDPSGGLDATGQIDAGNTVPNDCDRYVDVEFTSDAGNGPTIRSMDGYSATGTVTAVASNTSFTITFNSSPAPVNLKGRWLEFTGTATQSGATLPIATYSPVVSNACTVTFSPGFDGAPSVGDPFGLQ